MRKIFQKLFGRKQTSDPLSQLATTDMPSQQEIQGLLEKKKQGELIPPFNLGNPDHELIKLATMFAEGYKTLPAGDYYSDNKTYHISYKEKLETSWGAEVTTYSRVGVVSGVIEFSRKRLLSSEKITPDFVFYSVIWAIVQFESKDYFASDMIAMKHYMTTNRSIKNFATGFLTVTANDENMELNEKRYQSIISLLKAHGVW